MDELFDKIKDGASKTKDVAGKLAKVVAKRTSNAITLTKLSYSINEANNKITDIYTEIGKAMYENHLDNTMDTDFTDLYAKINELMHDVECLKAKKDELKNCTDCDTQNSCSNDCCSEDEYEISKDEIIEEITITPEKG